jgi:hypothetical protein
MQQQREAVNVLGAGWGGARQQEGVGNAWEVYS